MYTESPRKGGQSSYQEYFDNLISLIDEAARELSVWDEWKQKGRVISHLRSETSVTGKDELSVTQELRRA